MASVSARPPWTWIEPEVAELVSCTRPRISGRAAAAGLLRCASAFACDRGAARAALSFAYARRWRRSIELLPGAVQLLRAAATARSSDGGMAALCAAASQACGGACCSSSAPLQQWLTRAVPLLADGAASPSDGERVAACVLGALGSTAFAPAIDSVWRGVAACLLDERVAHAAAGSASALASRGALWAAAETSAAALAATAVGTRRAKALLVLALARACSRALCAALLLR